VGGGKGGKQGGDPPPAAALKTLAGQLDHDAASASDAKRVNALATVVKRLETR
jgi:hypothetical protein